MIESLPDCKYTNTPGIMIVYTYTYGVMQDFYHQQYAEAVRRPLTKRKRAPSSLRSGSDSFPESPIWLN